VADPKQILTDANAAIAGGDHEGFLRYCSEDIEWEVVGERTFHGKPAVREYLVSDGSSLTRFTVTEMIAEGDLLTVLGDLFSDGEDGTEVRNAYCDVWRFRGDEMVQLRAFVIPVGTDTAH
jgi:ketosteroid isomerase-like protein